VHRVAVEQPDCECGYIAARVMAAFRGAGALWGAVDVADANRPHWVSVGNALLGLPDRVHWLAETQVMKLAAVWDPRNDDGGTLVLPSNRGVGKMARRVALTGSFHG
jgi:hypothetical protein